jgi:hypothetical protein
MLKKITRGWFLLLWAGLALQTVLHADTYEDFWFTVDGGGGMFSTGGGYTLGGTIGQPDATAAAAMTGGTFTLTGGFWAVAVPTCTSFAPADFNQDCRVDAEDRALFDACFTGPEVPYNPVSPPPGCVFTQDGEGHIAPDFDGNGDVDQRDYAVFQKCYSGPDANADPNCAN